MLIILYFDTKCSIQILFFKNILYWKTFYPNATYLGIQLTYSTRLVPNRVKFGKGLIQMQWDKEIIWNGGYYFSCNLILVNDIERSKLNEKKIRWLAFEPLLYSHGKSRKCPFGPKSCYIKILVSVSHVFYPKKMPKNLGVYVFHRRVINAIVSMQLVTILQ